MKRDMELIRKISFYIENNYEQGEEYLDQISIPEYDNNIINEHCLLIQDNDLLQKVYILSSIDCYSTIRVGNLSAKGYDYLDKFRDDGTWKKIISTIIKKGLDMSIKTIETVATAFITAATEDVASAIIKNKGI